MPKAQNRTKFGGLWIASFFRLADWFRMSDFGFRTWFMLRPARWTCISFCLALYPMRMLSYVNAGWIKGRAGRRVGVGANSLIVNA
jgi:hypothetical protein